MRSMAWQGMSVAFFLLADILALSLHGRKALIDACGDSAPMVVVHDSMHVGILPLR